LYEGVLGKKVTIDDIILESEKVYNFQRLFNLRMGYGTRIYDYPPYRAVGPVTEAEYESRAERYNKSLREEVGIDPDGMKTTEKMNALRRYREDRYEQLVDAVYKRRGWTRNGIPTLETVQRLGIDYPEVVELVKQNS
jgi:aldehyde:ferredoxin oxidoreductase